MIDKVKEVDVEGFDRGFELGKKIGHKEGHKLGTEEAEAEAEKDAEKVKEEAEGDIEVAREEGIEEGRESMRSELLERGSPLAEIVWRSYLVNPIDTENALLELGLNDLLSELKARRMISRAEQRKQTEKARRAEERVEQERDARYRNFQPSLCH